MLQILKRLWNYIRLKNAIIYATKMHQKTHKKYYVISIGGKIRVISRLQANILCDKDIFMPRMRNDYYLRKYSLFVAE